MTPKGSFAGALRARAPPFRRPLSPEGGCPQGGRGFGGAPPGPAGGEAPPFGPLRGPGRSEKREGRPLEGAERLVTAAAEGTRRAAD